MALIAIAPIVKIIIFFKCLFGCCKRTEREEPVHSTPSKKVAVTSFIFNPQKLDVMVPRYSSPPIHPKKEWDSEDCGLPPETTPHHAHTTSRHSLVSMEGVYQTLAEPQDAPKDPAGGHGLVPFVKAGNLKKTLHKLRVAADERSDKMEEK